MVDDDGDDNDDCDYYITTVCVVASPKNVDDGFEAARAYSALQCAVLLCVCYETGRGEGTLEGTFTRCVATRVLDWCPLHTGKQTCNVEGGYWADASLW